MITKLTLTKVSLKLKDIEIQRLKDEKISKIWVDLRIETSFGHSSEYQLSSIEENVQQKTIQFVMDKQIYFQDQNQNFKAFIFGRTQQETKILFCQQIKVEELLIKKQMTLNQDGGSVSFEISQQVLQNVKTMEIKNTIIQLLSLGGQSQKMILEVVCGEVVYRSNSYETKLFWQEVLNIFITHQKQITLSLIKENGQKMKLSDIKFNEFPPGAGFKRNLLTNEEQFPVGCLSFEYKITGDWNYEQDKIAQLLCKQQLYKIQILKLKGKLKQPQSRWMFKIVSDINKLDIQELSEEFSSTYEGDINRHLYSCEPKCNFMLFCQQGDEKMTCNAIMNLQMTGKFQKRVNIKDLTTNKTLGHLFIHTQCLKVDTVTIKFKNIHLKITNRSNCPEEQIFMKGQVGGCFGKTEIQKVDDEISFIKNLQVKFSMQQFVDLVINSPDQDKHQHIKIQLNGLQQRQNKEVICQFGDSSSYLQGVLSCEYQFMPRQTEMQGSINKTQQKMTGYDKNLVMNQQVIQKAARLGSPDVKRQSQTSQIKDSIKQVDEYKKKVEIKQKSENKQPEVEIKKHTSTINMKKNLKDGPNQLTVKEKQQIKIDLQNHVTEYKVTKKRTKSKRKQGSEKKSPNQLNPRDHSFKKQAAQSKFQHIINIYMGDKPQNLSRKRYEKVAVNKTQPQGKNRKDSGKSQLDLPQIKVYRNPQAKSRSPIGYYDSYFNKKRYVLPSTKANK